MTYHGVRNLQVSNSQTGDFLRRLQVKHGPVPMLGRFFLKAEAEAQQRGVSIWFGTPEELVRVNRENSDSWRPLIALFDDRHFTATPDNCMVLFCRDRSGRVVAAHAARLFEWPNTTFRDEAESLRLLYEDPDRMRLPGEACEVTAPSAERVGGTVVYSGAAWCHPEFRGSSLSKILPRVCKAYALTRWPADTIVSLMVEAVHARGFAPHFGYDNVDWSVFMKNTSLGTFKAAFLSVSREHTFDYASELLADSSSHVDAAVLNRRA